MPLTINELSEKLATVYDEVSLLELLDINSFDIVNAFQDRIENRYEELCKEFDEEETTED